MSKRSGEPIRHQPRTLRGDLVRLSHNRTAQVSGVLAMLATVAYVGASTVGNPPKGYEMPRGVVITGPAVITPAAGDPAIAKDITTPTYVGVAGPYFGLDGLPVAGEHVMDMGVDVIPVSDGSAVNVYVMTGPDAGSNFIRNRNLGLHAAFVALGNGGFARISLEQGGGYDVTVATADGGYPDQQAPLPNPAG